MDKQIMPLALSVKKLTVAYQDAPVLWSVDVEVPIGSLLAVIGPNGAGKTTFMKSILGLLKPLAGTISFLGQPATHVIASGAISYVPQRMSVDWDFPISVEEVVMMGRYGSLGWFSRPTKQDKKMVADALKQVNLEAFAQNSIGSLSGGQQQRVFFARALAQQAEIYILDEPFVNIDAVTEQMLIGILQQLASAGKTVIVVHHDLHTVRSYFKTALLLKNRKIAHGPVEQIVTPFYLEQVYGAKYYSATNMTHNMSDIIGYGMRDSDNNIHDNRGDNRGSSIESNIGNSVGNMGDEGQL